MYQSKNTCEEYYKKALHMLNRRVQGGPASNLQENGMAKVLAGEAFLFSHLCFLPSPPASLSLIFSPSHHSFTYSLCPPCLSLSVSFCPHPHSISFCLPAHHFLSAPSLFLFLLPPQISFFLSLSVPTTSLSLCISPPPLLSFLPTPCS